MKIFNPVGTYRIQFHQGFTFRDAEKLVPYLAKLGIGAIYASPIFTAVPGSIHGYDVTDPESINPEIGTLAELRSLSKKLKTSGIGWIQDVVPNHMAFHPENKWLMDILEKGKDSDYAAFFDTSFHTGFFEGKLMVPFLGDTLDAAIQRGELMLSWKAHRFFLSYFDQCYPVNLATYQRILITSESPTSITAIFETLEAIAAQGYRWSYTEHFNGFLRLLEEALKDRGARVWLKKRIAELNRDQTVLKQIVGEQFYEMTPWQETDKRINYRRFFTINGLICLNMQDDEVFSQYHRLIKQLIDEQVFSGLRVDHVDGLYDPAQYLQRLRLLIGPTPYIVVEKILGQEESLASSWPIQGTTGYDFLAQVNQLFTASNQMPKFSRFYQDFTKDHSPIAEQAWAKKENFLYTHMQGELHNLFRLLEQSGIARKQRILEIGETLIKRTLVKILVHCPVYRYYGNQLPLPEEESQALNNLLAQINNRFPDLTEAVALLAAAFLKLTDKSAKKEQAILTFYQRLMQISGPLMAKGVEDTLMYTFSCFVAHNEVGDSPAASGMLIQSFHQRMMMRQRLWPLAINATATHDTKRGEDVRMRLNSLSNWAKEWKNNVTAWERLLVKEDTAYPDVQDRYFIYQNLVGAWPLLQDDIPAFRERANAYIEKALREAKRHSSWTQVNVQYEKQAKQFAQAWIDLQLASEEQQNWLGQVADIGLFYSLVQLAIKVTAPGVPDIYQGNEGWDFHFVDPDNRSPVAFDHLERLLEEQETQNPSIADLWSTRKTGAIKLWLTQKLLTYRKTYPDIFEKGRYIPLRVRGRYRKEVMAFARQYQKQWCIVILPVHSARLCREQKKSIDQLNWKNTRIDWPLGAPDEFTHIIDGKNGTVQQGTLMLEEWVNGLPLVVLNSQEKKKQRSAGILLAISSLPGPFGIGDFGPAAYRFARFLKEAKQGCWQILPLGPTGEKEHYSPYSAFSTMGGNPLYISLELLAKAGWLSLADLKKWQLSETNQVDYSRVVELKEHALEQAYTAFSRDATPVQFTEFADFVKKEQAWLDDFALYLVIKRQFHGKGWYEWPKSYRQRDKKILVTIQKEKQRQLEIIKWQQYIFFRQWQALKQYVNSLGIQIFGDLPFYVNHDSVDVWANQELFALDAKGRMRLVAGVPPDYFNADGQLWGMPVFNWGALKEQGYQWWVDRISRQISLFDLIRLDHFRAFYNYWQVSAEKTTAKEGAWALGPGEALFKVFQQHFGKLPFVAEDLGDIHPEVYALRDALQLPGMKVLQFAFGNDMANSLHIPHHHEKQFVVYTGTHDNNTLIGWYRYELTKGDRDRVQEYFGKKIKEGDIYKQITRLAYASVAHLVILPMQDVLGLDEKSRMNTPATTANNWRWRLRAHEISSKHAAWLRKLVHLYGR